MKKFLFPLLLGAGTQLLGAGMLTSCGEEAKEVQQKEARLSFQQIDTPADSLSRYPHLLVDEEGRRLWMSWMVQHRPDSASLWMAALDAERGEWAEPVLISAGSKLMVNWADYPHLLLNGSGEPGILYLQTADPTEPYAYHVMWKQANQPAQRLHSDSSATEHGFVSSVALPNKQAGVVWLDGRKYAGSAGGHDSHGHGGEMTLRYRPIAADGSLLAARELDGRTCDCCNTAMVATAKGPIAFYRNRSEEEIRDIYFVRQQDGKWTAPKPLHEDGWEMRACPVNGPAADARGEALAVAWYTGAGGNHRVNVRFSPDAGESWGPVLVADSLQPMGRVGVKLLDNGSALLSWLNEQGELSIRQTHPDGSLGEVQILADSLSSRKSGFPQLVRLKDKVYVAWTRPEPYVQLALMEGKFVQE